MTAVNTVGFDGALYASVLSDVIHSYLGTGQTAGAVDMLGRIRYPSGAAASEVLQVPDEPGEMVSPKTVQFFADASRVGVSVVTRLPAAL